MANVAFQNKELKALLPQYELIRDCLAGEASVKFRKAKYLPVPNPADTTAENLARYDAYLARAVFYNVAQRTQYGLRGQIFLRDPVIEIPSLLEAVKIDATGSGVSLEQLAQEGCDYALAYGRFGVFVDYPDTETPASRDELESGDIRPTLKNVAPWDAINWRVVKLGAKIKLSLVVFRETYDVEDDGFETKTKDQYRVLRLDEDGVYVNEVYRNKIGASPDERYIPEDAQGVPFKELPFIFVGSVNNDPKPDAPPMYALCSINMAHYRNSADYEESVFFVGQPTIWFSGLTEEWVKNVMGGEVRLGVRGGVPLPKDASAGILQAEPNTLAKEAMEQKEAQMLALGAKLVEGSQVQRTATEASFDNVSENSVLSSVAKNVGAGYEWGLQYAARFVGQETAKIEFKLNTEFDLVNLSPEERKTLIAEWQSGGITFSEYRENLRRGGIAFKTDEEAKAEIAQEEADRMANAVKEAEAMAAVAPPSPPPGE